MGNIFLVDGVEGNKLKARPEIKSPNISDAIMQRRKGVGGGVYECFLISPQWYIHDMKFTYVNSFARPRTFSTNTAVPDLG